jgi:hypothetical protein
MTKTYNSRFTVIASSLLLSILYCPPFDIFCDDKEVFQYTGRAILKGLTPYRDFFDHKPPLIFFLNAAGLLAGSWGLWIIDTLLVLWASLLLFRLGRKYLLPHPWLLPLFFNLFLRDHLLCKGIGMTREYTAILFIMAFCVVMGEYRHRFLKLGLITGLTFFMQQDQILPLLPLVVVALIPEIRTAGNVVRHVLFLAAGFVIVAIPLVGYFAIRHSLTEYWDDAFRFNFMWYTAEKQTAADHFKAIKNGLEAVNAGGAVLTACTLGMGALLMRKGKTAMLIACLVSVILSLAPEFLSGRMPIGGASFYYYFLPLSASLSALLFVVFATKESFTVVNTGASQLLFGFLLCCALGYSALQYAAGLTRHGTHFVKDSPELNYLRQHPPKDYQVYVFGDANYDYVYNEFKILAPSKWIYHHFWFWYDRWDANMEQMELITDQLRQHHTQYILDMSAPEQFRNAAHFEYWHSFLSTLYRPVTLPGLIRQTVWQLKDVPPSSGQ